MSAACAEVVWLRSLLDQLGFSQPTPTPLYHFSLHLYGSSSYIYLYQSYASTAPSISCWQIVAG